MKRLQRRYMKAFNKIYNGLDITLARQELANNAHLFGELNARKDAGPVMAQMDDIWLRYGDVSDMIKTGDYSKISGEHDSIWLKDLTECKKLCFKVMSMVSGERLGGVIITRLPAGCEMLPHTDDGWHANYYDKYYIPLENKKGAVFGFDEGDIAPDLGDVWAFDNSFNHWVKNNSDGERIAMIVCIKQDKYNRGGLLCHTQ